MVIVMLVLVLYILGFDVVPSYGSQNTCTASTAVDGSQDDATQKVAHYNVDAGQKTAHYNPDASQKMAHYNVDAGQKVAHYNVDAGQKTAQNLEENCNSQAILKVKKQSQQCFPSL